MDSAKALFNDQMDDSGVIHEDLSRPRHHARRQSIANVVRREEMLCKTTPAHKDTGCLLSHHGKKNNVFVFNSGSSDEVNESDEDFVVATSGAHAGIDAHIPSLDVHIDANAGLMDRHGNRMAEANGGDVFDIPCQTMLHMESGSTAVLKGVIDTESIVATLEKKHHLLNKPVGIPPRLLVTKMVVNHMCSSGPSSAYAFHFVDEEMGYMNCCYNAQSRSWTSFVIPPSQEHLDTDIPFFATDFTNDISEERALKSAFYNPPIGAKYLYDHFLRQDSSVAVNNMQFEKINADITEDGAIATEKEWEHAGVGQIIANLIRHIAREASQMEALVSQGTMFIHADKLDAHFESFDRQNGAIDIGIKTEHATIPVAAYKIPATQLTSKSSFSDAEDMKIWISLTLSVHVSTVPLN